MSKQDQLSVNKPSLMILSDDCLFCIMDKLNILDLLRLKQVNKRLFSLCLLHMSRRKVLSIPGMYPAPISNNRLKQIVGFCSSSLRTLAVHIHGRLTLDNIIGAAKECANLVGLNLSSEMSEYLPYSPHEGQYMIEIGEFVSQNVKEMHLCGINCKILDILVAFPNLERLSCGSMQFLKSEGVKIPKNKLKALELKQQAANAESILNDVVPKLRKLEKFSLAVNEYRNDLHAWSGHVTRTFSRNKKLKEVRMSHWRVDDQELTALGNSIYGQLEAVKFHGCFRVTDEGFLSFLKTQPNLKVVEVRAFLGESYDSLLCCLDDYVKARPVKEEALTVIIDWVTDTSKFSAMLNFVTIPRVMWCVPCACLLDWH